MSTGALKSLKIEHLRGAVTAFSLPFEKGKKLTIVYGENGTGKSTICDAFDFVGRGGVGSLENRGLGKTAQYWYSLGKSPADIAVTIDTADGACRATVGKNGVLATPADKRPRVEVLRRAQILSLIEAPAAKRYEAVSRFIDVSEIETGEGSLRDAIKSLKSGRDTAIARIDENEKSIRSLWETAGSPEIAPNAWAEQESSRSAGSVDTHLEVLAFVRRLYERLAEDAEKIEAAEEGAKAAHEAMAAAQAALDELTNTVSADATDIMRILEAAKPHLDGHVQLAVCPLCESSEKTEGLAARVGAKLETFSALRSAHSEAKIRRDNAVRANDYVARIRKEAEIHAADFQSGTEDPRWPDAVDRPDVTLPAEPARWGEWLEATADLLDKWRAAEAAYEGDRKFLAALKTAVATLAENVSEQEVLDALLPKMEHALEIVARERREFTDAMLATIADEVGQLYDAVHPGEGLNKISLELDPNKRSSLAIATSFCGSECTPQAYFSDSHLDTLGLCILLALAARDSAAETILVLDDVLGSIDEPHVDRLIEMLYDVTTRFRHCVITTHYRPWKQKLRWGWLRNGQCQFVELTRWTVSGGLTLIRSTPDVERLRLLLAESPADAQLVCAKAGVILEAVLDFLTQLYQCAVPRRPDGTYTLGDLLPAVGKKLRQSLEVEVLGTDALGAPAYARHSLEPIFEELTKISVARNVVGCHFNKLSFELLDSHSLGFGQQVLALADLIADPEAGWPKSDKSGKYWATSGETRRLHPLKTPS